MMVWDNMVCSESRSKEDRVMTVLGPRFRSLALWMWHWFAVLLWCHSDPHLKSGTNGVTFLLLPELQAFPRGSERVCVQHLALTLIKVIVLLWYQIMTNKFTFVQFSLAGFVPSSPILPVKDFVYFSWNGRGPVTGSSFKNKPLKRKIKEGTKIRPRLIKQSRYWSWVQGNLKQRSV